MVLWGYCENPSFQGKSDEDLKREEQWAFELEKELRNNIKKLQETQADMDKAVLKARKEAEDAGAKHEPEPTPGVGKDGVPTFVGLELPEDGLLDTHAEAVIGKLQEAVQQRRDAWKQQQNGSQ